MNVSSRVVAGVAILYLEGRLVAGSERAPSLRAAVRELIEDGHLVVLLHMARVTDMDAHGIGVLVSSLTALLRHGGRMALVAPSPLVRRLLAVTRVDTVLTAYDSAAEAVAGSRPLVVATASRNSLSSSTSVAVLDGSM